MTKRAFPTAAEKAKRTLLGVEIPRDELALRMMIAAIGLKPPAGVSTKDALALAEIGNPGMTATFRRQADAAVLYFAERISAAKQPH